MGYGSLVLVPAVLAFVSMSYALSTLNGLQNQLWLAFLGGLIWSFMIFAFDRFIVSSHRRKTTDLAELKRPVFYLRFGFALILGIVISHPLVMLYFNGSISDQMEKNIQLEKELISTKFQTQIVVIEEKENSLDSTYWQKVNKRDQQAEIVAKEIDGAVIRNAKGELETTGLRGKGPSAENKIAHLNQLENELAQLKIDQANSKQRLEAQKEQITKERDSSLASFYLSTDYLHQERALEQLKEGNAVVAITQWFIIVLFVLVDLLPFIFKTFSSYGLYDKVLGEEEDNLKNLSPVDRTHFWNTKMEQANQF